MPLDAREVSTPLELELQRVVSHHVGDENNTGSLQELQVLLTMEPCLQTSQLVSFPLLLPSFPFFPLRRAAVSFLLSPALFAVLQRSE